MMNRLQTQNKIFINCQKQSINQHLIPTFEPLKEIVLNTSACFRYHVEEDDDSAKLLKWSLWNIRQAVSLSIMPFDSDVLFLREDMQKIRQMSRFYPPLLTNLNAVIDAVEYLLVNPYNPKRRFIFELLENCEKSNEKYGLVGELARAGAAGWGKELASEISNEFPHCKIILSRKQLLTEAFDRIILPTRSKSCPVIGDIINGGRSKDVDFVSYNIERQYVPKIKKLPESSLNLNKSKLLIIEGSNEDAVSSIEVEEEDKVYWEGFRTKFGIKSHQETNHYHVINARLIVLANQKIIYLKEDKKVFNLISLVNEDSEFLHSLKSFPRTVVKRLSAGDLIILRTSGSGDYLKEVADSLLRKDGKGSLRDQAVAWKGILKKALEAEGSHRIFSMLKSKGHELSSHNYLWEWTTDDVISPDSESKFLELMAILDDFGYKDEQKNLVEYADSKWELMKELKHYHQKAGAYIRNELLNEVRKALEYGRSIENELTLNVLGEDSGALTVFRICEVDPEVHKIPYNSLGQIHSLLESR